MNTITVYETKWGGSIKTIDATTEPGKRTQAGMEHVNFVFGRVPNSDHVTCIDIAKEIAYVLLRTGEGAKQVVGCSCDYFKKEHKVCEHLFALKDIDVSKLKESDGWLVEFLANEEHWHVVDGKLVPPSVDDGKTDPDDAGKPIPEPAKRPTIPPDPEIDIGVDVSDNTTTKTTSAKDDTPKLWSRTCPYCPHVETGVFLDPVKAAIAEHVAICPENPANKPDAEVQKPESQKETTVESPAQEKPKAPGIPQDPEIDIGVGEEVPVIIDDVPMVDEHGQEVHEKPEPPKGHGVKKMTPKFPKTDKPKKSTSIFDDIEDLIEFGVGQIFGDTGTGKTAFCRELAEKAADAGKKVVYWDSEGNMTRKQRASMAEHKNIEYILDRDWEDIRRMLPVTGEDNRTGQSIYSKTPKLKKCDLFILDSIGVPVLGIYGDLKQNQKGEALQGMQGLVYRLGAWAEKNDAVVIITNQPTSEMNKTKEQIAQGSPFGDKAKYFTKEILKIVIGERGEYKTVCHLLAWRSRSRGRGAMLGKVTISDKGTEIEFGG